MIPGPEVSTDPTYLVTEVPRPTSPSAKDECSSSEDRAPREAATLLESPPSQADQYLLGLRSASWSPLPDLGEFDGPLPLELKRRYNVLRSEFQEIRQKLFPRRVDCAPPDPAVLNAIPIEARGDVLDGNEFLKKLEERLMNPEVAFVPKDGDQISQAIPWDNPKPELVEFRQRLARARSMWEQGVIEPLHMDAIVAPYVRNRILERVREALVEPAYQLMRELLIQQSVRSRLEPVIGRQATPSSGSEPRN